MSRLFALFWVFLLGFSGVGQAQNPAKFTAVLEPQTLRIGEMGRVMLTAQLEKGWHIYGPYVKGGPIASRFELPRNPHLQLAGNPMIPAGKIKFDEGFQTNVTVLAGTFKVGFPVQVTSTKAGSYRVNLSVLYQACTNRSCLPPTTVAVPLQFRVQGGAIRPEFAAPSAALPAQAAQNSENQSETPQDKSRQSLSLEDGTRRQSDEAAAPIQYGEGHRANLAAFMLAAFGAGFLAILTPCVFPMIPITVSLFSKRGGGLSGPIAYCAGIIGTFTVLGVAVSLIFGAAGLSLFAANPWVNLALAALFIVLALNLFGVFEIIVPASVLSRVQPHAGAKQSLLAPVLMGFAFTLTSFTCTVPFVGTALVSAATQGPFYPALGMLCFSAAFALPFLLLALFPRALQKLPRSGSWLISVKAFMGFLELAAALKFLQTADYVWNLGLITRPVFLAIWFAIVLIAGCYLLRWLRLPKDDEALQIGPVRRTLGFATLGVALLLLSANNGRSLGDLNAFLPPRDYGIGEKHSSKWLVNNLEAAKDKARKSGKPLLINFTGYACTNCRLMENDVLPHPDVLKELDGFVAVELYTDGADAKSRSFGAYQRKTFGTIAIPMYAVLTPDGQVKGRLDGLERSPQKFAQFLRDAAEKTRWAAAN